MVNLWLQLGKKTRNCTFCKDHQFRSKSFFTFEKKYKSYFTHFHLTTVCQNLHMKQAILMPLLKSKPFSFSLRSLFVERGAHIMKNY